MHLNEEERKYAVGGMIAGLAICAYKTIEILGEVLKKGGKIEARDGEKSLTVQGTPLDKRQLDD